MRFLILFLLPFVATKFCYAQKDSSIIGKWQVYAVMGDDYYHNFDIDSTALTNKFKEELAGDKKDTGEAIKMIKALVQIFKNALYIFKPDSTYQSIFSNLPGEEGKYSIDFKQKQIHTISNTGSTMKQQATYNFNLNGGTLQLKMPAENDDVTFYYKKIINNINSTNYIMPTSNYSTYFTVEENKWLSANADIKKELFEEIDDISNVNPLDNGKPDLRPLKIAIKATKLTIQVCKKNILEGPYDATHFQLIKSTFPKIKFSEKKLWPYFSFMCANKKEEGFTNKQRIYLSVITSILLDENGENIDIPALPKGVYNFDTNKTEYIQGEGVNAFME